MDNVALGIVIIIAGLIVLTIILKLCTKFVYLRYFLMVPLLNLARTLLNSSIH